MSGLVYVRSGTEPFRELICVITCVLCAPRCKLGPGQPTNVVEKADDGKAGKGRGWAELGAGIPREGPGPPALFCGSPLPSCLATRCPTAPYIRRRSFVCRVSVQCLSCVLCA